MGKFVLLSSIFVLLVPVFCKHYDPNWASLDSRPLPQWFDDAKFGIFLHWGVFSVPSFQNEWFWSNWFTKNKEAVAFMENYYGKHFTYADFAPGLKAEFFNPADWADIFASSGAKYVVLTTKHHEGFSMWPSKYAFNWNAHDVGAGRDLVGDLGKAVRAKNLTFGLYHSLLEWFNPMYDADRKTGFRTQEFVFKKVIPEMKELIEMYKPSILFSDGEWEAPDTYWNSTNFLAWLYNESPVKDYIVVNDRWGKGIPCHHGDFYTCHDMYNPGTLQTHKWENAMVLDTKSWGYRRNIKLNELLPVHELIRQLVSSVSCGGNVLMNVGPTRDGMIDPIFQERLKDMGTWLSINGEAIYSSKPWTIQKDIFNGNVWYTSKPGVVYCIPLFWPLNNILTIKSVTAHLKNSGLKVTLLGSNGQPLKYTIEQDMVHINFPDKAGVKGDWAYVLKIAK